MIARLWMSKLPSTDAAFTPLNRASRLDPEEFGLLERAHRQAMLEAAWGKPLADLDTQAEVLRLAAVHEDGPRDEAQAELWRRGELEALGYALGVTAARVAIREHAELAVAS